VTSKQTPLHSLHERAGASFTDFSGWSMPVRYSSDLAEHHAVRTTAGLFDLSHMAEIRVTGPDAGAALDYALSGRLSVLENGEAKYSLILNERAGIIDDLVVYRLAEDDYLVVANAGNRDEVVTELTTRIKSFDASVRDDTDQTVMMAVQGPSALVILDSVPGLQLETGLSGLGYYRITSAVFHADSVEAPLWVARTGYTGEDGFELYIDTEHGVALWQAVVVAGGEHDLQLCGLAARDTLRLEAGMALYGNELHPTTRPAEARLGRVVDKEKDDFVGKAWLVDHPEPPARILVGLVAEGRRAARAGYPVVDPGTMGVIGQVTSGALSPTLGYPIAMAMVERDFKDLDTELHLDVRGQMVPARVVALPFYRRRKD
jgi:aminomethyltransferase